MPEIAIGEPHARHGTAKTAFGVLDQIEARLERKALQRRAHGLTANLQRIAGNSQVAHRAGACELYRPAAPPSSRMRPAPRVPSKHVNANILPDTNLRASSALIVCPAKAGATTAAAKRSPTQNARACLTPTYWAGSHLYPLLTIPTMATLAQVGWLSLNAVREFLPQFAREPRRRGFSPPPLR